MSKFEEQQRRRHERKRHTLEEIATIKIQCRPIHERNGYIQIVPIAKPKSNQCPEAMEG